MSSEYIKNYNKYHTAMFARKKALEGQLREVDLKVEDILHFLENEKCNAATMAKITKTLKALRLERRTIKNEWNDVNTICQKVNRPIEMKEKCTFYRYRTDIITECTGILIQDLNKGVIM